MRSAGGSQPYRRWLRLALAALWLLDAALQFQPFMFTKGFSLVLAGAAAGNPQVVAGPIRWDAHLIAQHPGAATTVFALTQLLIALAIAWPGTVKIGLAASIVWAFGVWWLGEGMGGVLTGTASPVTGAPGAVLLYAVLAVLLWPASKDTPPRLVWLTLWECLAYLMLASATAQGVPDQVRAMTAGQPGWLAAMNRAAADALAGRGVQASAALAAILVVIAVGVFLPAPAARVILTMAVAVAALIWAVGEDFGGIFTGTGTDPNTGPLLALLAAVYWPRPAAARGSTSHPVSGSGHYRSRGCSPS